MKSASALVLAVLFTVVVPVDGRASDLLGPIWHLQGKHIGYTEHLSWFIEYLDQEGCTEVNANGALFRHGSCQNGVITTDPSWLYPDKYWGQYPLYYLGGTMKFRITLANTHTERVYRHLRLVAIQEYFSPEGEWGEWMGEDAAKDWYIPELLPGDTVVYESSFHIASNGLPGLNQTHIQVQHWNGGAGIPGPGSVLIDDAKAALWCPPEAAAEAAVPERAGAPEHAATPTVEIFGGQKGYVGSRQPLSIAYRALQAGKMRVAIVNRHGSIIWEHVQFTGGGGRETIIWDGKGLSGSPVPSGVYVILVEGPGVLARQKVAVVR